MYLIFTNKQYTRTFKYEYVGLDTFKYQTNIQDQRCQETLKQGLNISVAVSYN